jgi:hypothetical protein
MSSLFNTGANVIDIGLGASEVATGADILGGVYTAWLNSFKGPAGGAAATLVAGHLFSLLIIYTDVNKQAWEKNPYLTVDGNPWVPNPLPVGNGTAYAVATFLTYKEATEAGFVGGTPQNFGGYLGIGGTLSGAPVFMVSDGSWGWTVRSNPPFAIQDFLLDWPVYIYFSDGSRTLQYPPYTTGFICRDSTGTQFAISTDNGYTWHTVSGAPVWTDALGNVQEYGPLAWLDGTAF